MEINFSVEQRSLSMSDCERLCARPSREIQELANLSGCRILPGARLSVSVGSALNMLVLSTTKSNGVEPQAMTAWLPGLRNEALLCLGEEISNWSFEGTSEADQKFWPTLYDNRDVVRPRVARLLGCSTHGTISQLYFYTQNDVVCFPNSGFDTGGHDGPPRFTIFARNLADKLRATVGGSLFIANAMTVA